MKKHSLSYQDARAGYLFSIPFIIGFIFFFLFPVLQNINISFRTISASEHGMYMPWVGLTNYTELFFKDPWFMKDLFGSLKTLAINFPCVLLFSFFIATILNQKFRGRGVARAIFFLPVIISSGVILLIQDNQLQTVTMNSMNSAASSTDAGVTQMTTLILQMVESINIGPGIVDFVAGAVERVYDIVISSGVQILIFLAGLQTISPSLYEASSIEGATAWEDFWKITIPMISPLILVNAVYTIVDSMCGLSNEMVTKIYNYAFQDGNYGYSAAMGWIYFTLIMVLLGIFLAITSRLAYYEND